MSVANISAILSGTASAALPVRAVDTVVGLPRKPERDSGDMPDVALPHKTAPQSGVLADRFDPSPLAAFAGGLPAKTSQASKEDKAKAFSRELAAIQQAAAQTRYGVGGQVSSASLQREFESLLMAVNSGNLTAAEQALSRLQGASSDAGTSVTGGSAGGSDVPLPHTNTVAVDSSLPSGTSLQLPADIAAISK